MGSDPIFIDFYVTFLPRHVTNSEPVLHVAVWHITALLYCREPRVSSLVPRHISYEWSPGRPPKSFYRFGPFYFCRWSQIVCLTLHCTTWRLQYFHVVFLGTIRKPSLDPWTGPGYMVPGSRDLVSRCCWYSVKRSKYVENLTRCPARLKSLWTRMN